MSPIVEDDGVMDVEEPATPAPAPVQEAVVSPAQPPVVEAAAEPAAPKKIVKKIVKKTA